MSNEMKYIKFKDQLIGFHFIVSSTSTSVLITFLIVTLSDLLIKTNLYLKVDCYLQATSDR